MYKEKFYHSPWFIGLLFAFWPIGIPPLIAIVLIINRHKVISKHNTLMKTYDIENIIVDNEKLSNLKEDIKKLSHEKQLLANIIESYKPISDLVLMKDELKENIKKIESQQQLEYDKLKEIKSEIGLFEDELTMHSFGVFKSPFDLGNSEAYKVKLNETIARQKALIKEKRATYHNLDWTIGDDRKRGREFILDTIKLTLRAFNNECDNIINRVKFNNVEASENKIQKVYQDLNKLTDMQTVAISPKYMDLKIEQLHLKYGYELMKQQEKEEQMEIREQMREEAKALKELEKAQQKVEKEEKHFEQAIEKLKLQLNEDAQRNNQKLLDKLAELEGQLEETKKNKEDVLFRVQNTRAGYVYIISNIGSFGENVYKIGMTRRLEPLDRVRELGDASVPFLFDVHGMIFSDDAPSLEKALHKAFEKRRVNRINERKEFFRVSLDEIEKVVTENHNKTVTFTKTAAAEDYRQTVELEKQKELVVS
ncbi:DUF4041 domain-containing protein [Terribacillus aidingensis]|uniref:DUF4041 domain-containing protein n=1 Tax=Terribacillus aidingensis TaxID=586416 RepID=UPI00344B6853